MKAGAIDPPAVDFRLLVPRRRPHVKPRFVVQEHHARLDHFDFRLEKDGVLKSWVLPKGPPREPFERRLAIEVEDHPLAWGSFEGVVPPGAFGAGTVRIWDRGTYVLIAWSRDKIVFDLHGAVLEGKYALIRYPRRGNVHWLLLKYHEGLGES